MNASPEWLWRRLAACQGAPLKLFIVGDDEEEPFYPPPDALAYCNLCPVKPECLDYATSHDEEGVWGGTTSYQRRQLERERTRVHCPGCGAPDLVFENTVQLCLACGMSWQIIR